MSHIRKNAQRGRLVVTFFWMSLGVTILALISSVLQVKLLHDHQFGITITEEAINLNDLRESVIAIAVLLILIIQAILFIQWFRRAYYNLEQVRAISTKFKNEHVVWAWIIPILSLFRPYHMMREVWDKTQVPKEHPIYGKVMAPKTLIGWWWTFWLVGNFLSNISFRLITSDNFDIIMAGSIMQIFEAVANIVAILFAILVVKKVMEFEVDFYEEYAETDILDTLIDDGGY